LVIGQGIRRHADRYASHSTGRYLQITVKLADYLGRSILTRKDKPPVITRWESTHPRLAGHHRGRKTSVRMTNAQSAGILLYRWAAAKLEVFLVHPGGPFWKGKDAGTWTIPKGEIEDGEPALDAAVREFREETGFTLEETGPPLKKAGVPLDQPSLPPGKTAVAHQGRFQPLSPVRQKGGKRVFAWALSGNLDPAQIVSNTFELEWPRGSGRQQTFPEVDKGGWFTLPAARDIINPAQIALLEELEETLPPPPASK
jgi:predicted NUDIX family NTP pyrophosphohydrolase